MKKENILIIISIILFVYSYVLFWFDEILIILSMLTGGIAIFIIPICFLIILIQSIRYYKKEQNFTYLLPILILIIFVIFFFKYNPLKIKKEQDFNSKFEKRIELVEKIKIGEIEVEENNQINVPSEYEGLADNDYIYVYLNEDNKILIAFLYKAGFPDEDQYLFYSSGGQELIEENLNKSLYESITKKDENWYFVQFN